MLGPSPCAMGKYHLSLNVATAIPTTSPLPVTAPDPSFL